MPASIRADHLGHVPDDTQQQERVSDQLRLIMESVTPRQDAHLGQLGLVDDITVPELAGSLEDPGRFTSLPPLDPQYALYAVDKTVGFVQNRPVLVSCGLVRRV